MCLQYKQAGWLSRWCLLLLSACWCIIVVNVGLKVLKHGTKALKSSQVPVKSNEAHTLQFIIYEKLSAEMMLRVEYFWLLMSLLLAELSQSIRCSAQICRPTVSLKPNCVFAAPYVFAVGSRSCGRMFSKPKSSCACVCLTLFGAKMSSSGYLLLIPLNTDWLG